MEPRQVGPPTQESPSTIHSSKGWLVVQVLIGSVVGVISDYCAYFCAREILIRSQVISLTDAFEGDYSHPGLQRALACFVFIALLLCLLGLRRWSRVTYFATAALITHVLIGGLISLALLLFIDW